MIRMIISSKNILRELDFFETLYFQVFRVFSPKKKKDERKWQLFMQII